MGGVVAFVPIEFTTAACNTTKVVVFVFLRKGGASAGVRCICVKDVWLGAIREGEDCVMEESIVQ